MTSALKSLKEPNAWRSASALSGLWDAGNCIGKVGLKDGSFVIIGEEIKGEDAEKKLGRQLAKDEILVRIPSKILPEEFLRGASLSDLSEPIVLVGKKAGQALLAETPEGGQKTLEQKIDVDKGEAAIHITMPELRAQLTNNPASAKPKQLALA